MKKFHSVQKEEREEATTSGWHIDESTIRACALSLIFALVFLLIAIASFN